jgi:hypothetical protein
MFVQCYHEDPKMKKNFLLFFLILNSSFLYGFTVGYDAPPFVKPFAPETVYAHELITLRAFSHLCKTEGYENFINSDFSDVFLERAVSSCDEFDLSSYKEADYFDTMIENPLKGVFFGSRFPDLMEMKGVDAGKYDFTVVKYYDEVTFSVFDLYPQWHAGLIKGTYEMFGGDMDLALRVIRDEIRHVFHEVKTLILTTADKELPMNYFASFSSMYQDANMGGGDFWFVAPWTSVLLGNLFHMIEDSFAHNMRVLDIENNRVLIATLLYGEFERDDSADEIYRFLHDSNRDFTQEHGMKEDFDPNDLDRMQHYYSYTNSGPLILSDIPEFDNYCKYDGSDCRMRANFYESEGNLLNSMYLHTTLAMYAVYEFLDALFYAVENPEDPVTAEEILEEFIDKYYTSSYDSFVGYTRKRNHDIGAVHPEYRDLDFYNYHFVDVWRDSGLSDRIKDGKMGFILPWVDRNGRGGEFNKNIYGQRIVVQPHDTLRGMVDTGIFYVDKNNLLIFPSWNSERSGEVLEYVPEFDKFFTFSEDGYLVSEQEIIVNEKSVNGLNKPFAFVFVPAGYRLCFHYESVPDIFKASSTIWYDDSKNFYRCFYGGKNGRTTHVNFHIRKGTRLYLLPVDLDLDGVPYLKGYRDDVYSDNCPFDFNPYQNPEVCIEPEEEQDEYEEEKNDEDPYDDEESDLTEISDEDISGENSNSDIFIDLDNSERGCGCSLI